MPSSTSSSKAGRGLVGFEAICVNMTFSDNECRYNSDRLAKCAPVNGFLENRWINDRQLEEMDRAALADTTARDHSNHYGITQSKMLQDSSCASLMTPGFGVRGPVGCPDKELIEPMRSCGSGSSRIQAFSSRLVHLPLVPA
jgi:hypothetical protein